MSIVLSGISSDCALAYLDDIIVTGKSFEEHLDNMELVFDRLRQHGLKLDIDKCKLFATEVEFLGHIVSRNGIRPQLSNVQAILNFPKPESNRAVKRFCGMVNFYKKFIADSDSILRPLYNSTSSKFNWIAECDSAFDRAKMALTNAPVLAYPDFFYNSEFILTVDASDDGVGGVLSQMQEGVERVIGYYGEGFIKHQKSYPTPEKELAAIRMAVNHFKMYVYGRKYLIRTDHQPLIYLSNMKRVDARLMRTLQDLAIGQYEIDYVPGKLNTVADCLSRAHFASNDLEVVRP